MSIGRGSAIILLALVAAFASGCGETQLDDVKTEDEDAKWRKFAREVWAGMDQDRILGPCIVCQEAGRKQEDGSPHLLRIIKARKSGKRFVGCSGWDGDNPDSPDSCDTTFPLPQRVRASS